MKTKQTETAHKLVQDLLRQVEPQGIGGVVITMVHNDGRVGSIGASFPEQNSALERIDRIIKEAFPDDHHITLPIGVQTFDILGRKGRTH